MSNVRLIWVTPEAEKTIAYCARVSNPKNQENHDTAPKLLKYCLKNKHFSIFEMANMCVEIKTSRAIAQQILRHRSFSFQEFSQRYAVTQNFVLYEPRRQDVKNRQNSIDDLSPEDKKWFIDAQSDVISHASRLYKEAIDKGIAKECARFLLPLNTETVLYMNGTIRSWITYLSVRMDQSTQKEHRDVAVEIYKIFKEHFPIIASVMSDCYDSCRDEDK